jgi:hypothetical protein
VTALLLRLLRLGTVLVAAAGLAGLLAEPVSWRTGRDYLAGDSRPRAAGLSVDRCLELAHRHRARTCADALVEHDFGELVEYGLVMLVAGVVAAALLGRLIPPPLDRPAVLAELVVAAAGAVAFAAVAAASLPEGLAGLDGLEPGSGRVLLQGAVGGAGAAWLAWRALAAARSLLR